MEPKNPRLRLLRRPLLSQGERLTTQTARPPKRPGKFHPFTAAEAYEFLAPQGVALRESIDRLPSQLRGEHVVFEATLQPNYIAASWQPERLLAEAGLYVVGTRVAHGTRHTKKKEFADEPTKTLLLAGPPAKVTLFADLATVAPSPDLEDEWDQMRRFSHIGLADADTIVMNRPEVREGEVVAWEAVLNHVFENLRTEGAWADRAFLKWVKFVESLGGAVDQRFRRELDHMTFVPIELSVEAIDRAADFNLLRALRPMPQLEPLPDVTTRAFAGVTRRSRAAVNNETPEIAMAIFDGGANDKVGLLKPFLTVHEATDMVADPKFVFHGSLVASGALYGCVAPGEQLPDPPARIDMYRVLPAKNAYAVADAIDATLRTSGHRIAILAIGTRDPVAHDRAPTYWTAKLDKLASELDVTFIVAAGNNGAEDEGEDRVSAPADMVNGISVGACTSSDPTVKPERTVFSARGPGREGQRVQPTGVAFGGSDNAMFLGVDPAGHIAQSMGTSFGAPTLGRAIGELHGVLDASRRNPRVTRAFAAHFAERLPRAHKANDLGHGRFPTSFDGAFECAPNEATILYEETIDRRQPVALRFPLPRLLPAETPIELQWTVSFVTPVDARDAFEYTQAGLEPWFRPDERIVTITAELPDGSKEQITINTDVDKELYAQALAEGWRISMPPTVGNWRCFKTEQSLRQLGKWETLFRGRHQSTFAKLHRPRLDLAYLRREEGALVSGAAVPHLKVAMLATVRAPVGVPLYDLVAAEYPVLVPVLGVPVRISGTV